MSFILKLLMMIIENAVLIYFPITVMLHNTQKHVSPFDWGCRILRLYLYKGVRHLPNECPGYNIKQSDDEALVMLVPWGMRKGNT